MHGSKLRSVGYGIFALVVALMISPLCAPSVEAATLVWDRNNETDMKDYQVYACFTPSCVVVKSPGMLQPGAVLQPAVGLKPQYVIDIAGKEGAVAISARDQSTNESGLSVAVPFDQKAPSVPTNPAFQ